MCQVLGRTKIVERDKEVVGGTHGKRGSCVENNYYPHSLLLNLNSNNFVEWTCAHEGLGMGRPSRDKAHFCLEERQWALTIELDGLVQRMSLGPWQMQAWARHKTTVKPKGVSLSEPKMS